MSDSVFLVFFLILFALVPVHISNHNVLVDSKLRYSVLESGMGGVVRAKSDGDEWEIRIRTRQDGGCGEGKTKPYLNVLPFWSEHIQIGHSTCRVTPKGGPLG
jgi:hypothetical protein